MANFQDFLPKLVVLRSLWQLPNNLWTTYKTFLYTCNNILVGINWNYSLNIFRIIFGFTLKLVCDMIITYSQMHLTDKYSQHSSIIWQVWLNGWVFIYKPNGCRFESHCCHLNFRYGTCFEQGVHWHSGNYKVWIHSETQTWHDNNIQTVLNQGGAMHTWI